MLHINTDRTTKNQKKLGAVALNGVVVSVNELPDETATSTIEDVSKELNKLREVALTLGMSNASSINWTILLPQLTLPRLRKKFNKLVEQKRSEDEQKFGPALSEGFDLVANFCTMHLGINLRKAFLFGAKTSEDGDNTSGPREYHPTDTMVYEFCNLFGKQGTPENGCDGQTFPDFLHIMYNDPDLSAELLQYYLTCSVKLERQVGIRYFVTAANALKVQ